MIITKILRTILDIVDPEKEDDLEPSEHHAMLYVKNDHLETEFCHDLSDLTYEEMDNLFEYINFIYELRDVQENVEEFEEGGSEI